MSTQKPSSKQSTLPLLLIALGSAALAVALLSSLVMDLLPAPLPAVSTEVPAVPAPRAQLPSETSAAPAARMPALERRPVQLAARPTAAPQALPAQEPPQENAPPALQPDMKEQMRRVHEAFEQQVSAALREPSDALWSSRAGAALQGELLSLRKEDTYQVSRIDCRTHSCVAELNFPRHADARTSLSRLVINANMPGCSSTGHIDPSDDPSSPSRMRLLFDCDRSREAR
jgi:hypothetical protein